MVWPPLSSKSVKAGTKSKRYGDGNGLYLLVKPGVWSGKYWVQRLVIRGVRRELGLGSARLVPLKEARKAALDNLQLARSGGDPMTLRERYTLASTSFTNAVDKVIEMHEPTWNGKNGGRTAKQWRSSLQEYAYPRIGSKPIDAVTSADVMAILSPIWVQKHETAQRLRRRIAAVMKWAVAQGLRTDNPAADDIVAALPKVDRQRSHHQALPHAEVGAALARMRTADTNPATRLVLEFIVLCAVRSGEARMATWSEVDLPAATWTIPAERMKSKRQHRVPRPREPWKCFSRRNPLRPAASSFPRLSVAGPLSAGLSSRFSRSSRSPPCPMASGRPFATGQENSPTHPTPSWRQPSHTPSETRRRLRTHGRTCSSGAGP